MLLADRDHMLLFCFITSTHYIYPPILSHMNNLLLDLKISACFIFLGG